MRHGEAVANAETDAQRELTLQGREDIAQMAVSYGQQLANVDEIWASPYIRAQQTADIMAAHLKKTVSTHQVLSPGGAPADVLQALEQCQNQTILIVSHQPLVGVLVDGLADLEPGRYRMGTGALAALKTDVYANGCCELSWLYQPDSTQSVCL